MKKAAFKLTLESDKDYTLEQINEIRDQLLHNFKRDIENGFIPYTTGFSIRHDTPSITPSADHLTFPPKDTQFGFLGTPPKTKK